MDRGEGMADCVWLMHRLQAMSIPEVEWRLSQKILQKMEEREFTLRKSAVTMALFDKRLSGLQLDADKMHLNLENRIFSLNTNIPLLGGYDYECYKMRWNAGFQTENKWPDQFSYKLSYKQRDDIGDARTNWELNRHFQFALLAKDYFASGGDRKYLDEFQKLFEDWNQKNPFLWGISWTSVMEVAIRCSNWCYAFCFLKKKNAPVKLLNELQTGILNMTSYIAKHYSRFSSANNHLIVEAYAIGQTGVLCNYKPWIDLAIKILTRELTLQNYSDGINKELSLHYQSFYMEAMGLMMRLLRKNKLEIPPAWKRMLDKMCVYVADCMGDYGEVVAFGDNDEGKILDLQGGLNHYQYVLGMFSLMMDKQYTQLDNLQCENLNWLFREEEWTLARSKALYCPPLSACYREGGNSILRSNDHRVLIGIDHAALGFGSIAAHGHADALSFQMFVDGQPVFVDPGTYIYHCDLENRNAFRKTENHNTVCMNGKDQSEMLGAFLWGKKAECKLIEYTLDPEKIELTASQNGYAPIIHTRTFAFDKQSKLNITDRIENPGYNNKIYINYILAPHCKVNMDQNEIFICCGSVKVKMIVYNSNAKVKIGTCQYSASYGTKELTKKISIETVADNTAVKILVE